MTVEFRLDGQPYVGLNGGPQFTFSEAISFQIMCGDQEEVDHYWYPAVRRRRGGPVRVAQGPVRRLVAGRPDAAVRAARRPGHGPGPAGDAGDAAAAARSTSPRWSGRRTPFRPDGRPFRRRRAGALEALALGNHDVLRVLGRLDAGVEHAEALQGAARQQREPRRRGARAAAAGEEHRAEQPGHGQHLGRPAQPVRPGRARRPRGPGPSGAPSRREATSSCTAPTAANTPGRAVLLERRGEHPEPAAARRRRSGEDERQLVADLVPGRHRRVRQQHRGVRGDGRARWPPPTSPSGRASRPQQAARASVRRHRGGTSSFSAAAARPPGPYAARTQVPTLIGEVGLATRSMWWNRSGRPRSATRNHMLASRPPSEPSQLARRSAGRPVRSAPAASSAVPAARPPVNR